MVAILVVRNCLRTQHRRNIKKRGISDSTSRHLGKTVRPASNQPLADFGKIRSLQFLNTRPSRSIVNAEEIHILAQHVMRQCQEEVESRHILSLQPHDIQSVNQPDRIGLTLQRHHDRVTTHRRPVTNGVYSTQMR